MTPLGGAGDDPGVVVRPDGERGTPAPGLRTMGMVVFLASLTMLFAGCIAGYLVVRLRAETWPPPGFPGLPKTLWLSTALALACSGTIQTALGAIRRGDQGRLQRWLLASMAAAVAFLGVQSWNWTVVMAETSFRSHLYGFGFLMLTGLHAAHVLGGLVGLVVVWILASRGSYTWAHYSGVRNCALYWHYLSGVWIVLFALLLIG
jgi:cytochrome c oxidase subunit 3